MENYNLFENYLRKGEYPETINGKTEKANFEEDADRTSSLKMAASVITI